MREPWARVRISFEQPGRDADEQVWLGSVPIFEGDNIGETVGKFIDSWAQRDFQRSVEESWNKR